MKYSIKNKKQRNKKTRSSIRRNKKNNVNNKKTGGGCGCSRQAGGSSGPSNLSSLSPANYYQYYNVENDPKMNMVSTSTPSTITGGSLRLRLRKNRSNKKQNKNKNKKTKKMTGGISAADMVSSFGTPQLVSNVSSYLIGNNAINPPDYLQSTMSLNQGVSSTVPFVPPGMKYYV